MLAITVSLLTAIYLLGPDFFSRLILGFVVPRRLIQQSKSEEIARAVLTALIPLTLAVLWTAWHQTVVWPSLKPELKTVFSGLYSEKAFDKNPDAFFGAAKAVWSANWSIAWRLYAMLITYSILVDVVIVNYGRIRNSKWFDGERRKKALAIFVLPRVSEWHILLTQFSHKKSTRVTADIFTKSDVLYRGRIEKPFLGPDGSLSGLLISGPLRYDRQRYLEDKKAGKNPNKDEYWRGIPSNTFLMLASEISTINLRQYDDPADAEFLSQIEAILNAKLTAVFAEPPWSMGTEQPPQSPNDKQAS
jgi:hypothetical protein